MASRKTEPARRTRGRGVAPESAGWTSIDWELNPLYWLAAAAIVAVSLAPVGVMHLLRPGSAASSWLLASAVMTPFAIFAAMTLHYGRATPRRAALIALGLAVGGVAMAVFAGITDYGQRAVTLLELEVDGTAATGAQTVREVPFAVEHPGVEHTLTAWPTGAGPLGASSAVALRVEVVDAEGAIVLSREATLEPRPADSSTDWDTISARFTPAQAGRHTLRVMPLTANIPLVHVRIEDPLKTDGQRMPGY